MYLYIRKAVGALSCVLVTVGPAIANETASSVANGGIYETVSSGTSAAWNYIWVTAQSWNWDNAPTVIQTEKSLADDADSWRIRTLMQAVGYDVVKVSTTVGVIPKFVTRFEQKRQMSEADRRYALRLLRKDQRKYGRATVVLEKLVLVSILRFDRDKSYDLKEVVLTWLPIPSAEFITGPKKSHILGPEATILAARIEDLEIQIKSLAQKPPAP